MSGIKVYPFPQTKGVTVNTYCVTAPPLINISRELRWIQTAIRLRFECHTSLGSSGHESPGQWFWSGRVMGSA